MTTALIPQRMARFDEPSRRLPDEDIEFWFARDLPHFREGRKMAPLGSSKAVAAARGHQKSKRHVRAAENKPARQVSKPALAGDPDDQG